MKKLALIIIFALVVLPVFAQDNDTIKKLSIKIQETQTIVKPQQLARKQTKDYKVVNKLSERAFQELSIKVDVRPYKFYEDRFNSKNIENKEFYYELVNEDKIFSYNQGKLFNITLFSKDEYPCVLYAYSYPEGNLKKIAVAVKEGQSYVFNQYGEYIDFEAYLNNLQEKIKKNWYIFRYRNKKLAKILFTIDKNGKLLDYNVIESSGSKSFDDDAIAAIKTASPFDHLPTACLEDFITVQFTFEMNKKLSLKLKR
ncbi:MAG: hypothetical protein A2287_05150 [Candidatus Melainabacteria bacterium RIFOXYA12_FULL_32_12]|nr:MAG: hypothetical protein A2255_06290 [Candidatus Melainabacteria bacterium RIFOXYA2_FULL_32_9]OGI28909.1 MAG: hypothetical protein A2287_05150 [Candidatus Melainabacteria bacterium RIFOXYA12_FULL_32_12]